jgi:hypothetical protein
MTNLEIFLILIIYIIGGFYFGYKQQDSTMDFTDDERTEAVLLTSMFWPITFFVLIIRKILIDRW